MKKFFFVSALSVFLFLFLFSTVLAEECVTTTAKTKLFLNEISSASAHDDWVELYNLFDQCIDLSGFSVWDSSGSVETFSSSTFLNSGAYLNVDLNNRLNKAGDSVILKYGEEEWDRFDYGAGASYVAAEDGHVWARLPDGGSWATTTVFTPGATNGEVILPPIEVPTTTATTTPDPVVPTSTTPVSTSTGVGVDYSGLRLNEVLSDPVSGNEWVELFNLSTNTLSTGELRVCDSRLTSCKTTTGTVASESWFVFDLGSGFLNNSGDSAILKDSNENILDSISFGAIGEGRSFARSVDGTGSWAVTTQITPGAKNVVVVPPVLSSGTSGSSYAAKSVPVATTTTVVVSNLVTSTFLGKVVLNEILPDPEGVDTNDEFVEIKNISNTEINLAGWAIGDKDKKYYISGSISPSGLLFWRRVVSGIVLNNIQSEEVFLYDSNGNVVDRIKYDRAESGLSYSRFSVDWKWTNQITPGQENILEEEDSVGVVWNLKYPVSADLNEVVLLSAEESVDPRGGKLSFVWDFGSEKISGEEVEKSFVSSGVYVVDVFASSTAGTVGKKQIKITVGGGLSLVNSPIVISEVMSDPNGQDGREYIEIWNSGSSTIDLSGWQLRVGAKKYQIPDKTTISPFSCLVFYRAATKISLNNSGGKVELLAPGDSVVDVVKFGKSVSGKSYSSVNGEWILTVPTPGLASGAGEVKAGPVAVIKSTGNAGGVWYKTVSLNEAREQEKGVGVLVQGTVVVIPGIFSVQYFYISDGNAGIPIYQYKKDFLPLKVGDVVRVRGIISEANGQKRINIKQAKDVDILKTEQEVSIMNVDLSELEEQSLGTLVKVVGDITEKKSGYWYIDDGLSEAVVYFKKGAKINLADFLEGQKVEVVGVLERGNSGLQIWPRGQEDVKVVGVAKELEKPVVKKDVGTYFSAAAGAATTLLLGFFARARGLMFLAWFGRGAKAIAAIIRRS